MDEKGPVRLIYAGRLAHQQKRIGDIIPFLKALEALRIDYHLSVAGEGDDADELRRGLDAFICRGGRVTFCGALAHEALLRLLEQQHIYLLFSEYEGLPLSLLEAMSKGVVPVVSSGAGGISELFEEGKPIRFFPVGKSECAAEIVRELQGDRTAYAALSKQALALAQAYSLDRCLQAYVELYTSIRKSIDWSTPSSSKKSSRRFKEHLWCRLPSLLLHRFQDLKR